VVLGRAQVLAHGEHLDAVGAQDLERRNHLLEALAEADHQAGLGDDILAAELLRHPQHAA
jgi:hypothetical protein